MANSPTKMPMRSQKLFLNLERNEDKEFQKTRFAFSKTSPNFLKPTISSSAKRVSVKSTDHSMKITYKSVVNDTMGIPKKKVDHVKRRSNIQPWKPALNVPRSKPQEHKKETNTNQPRFVSNIQSRPIVKSEQKQIIISQTITSKLRTQTSLNQRTGVKPQIERRNVYFPRKTTSDLVTNTKVGNEGKNIKNRKSSAEFAQFLVNKYLEDVDYKIQMDRLENQPDNEYTLDTKSTKNGLNLQLDADEEDEDSVVLLENKLYNALGIPETKQTEELKSLEPVLPDNTNNSENQFKNDKTQAVLKWLEATSVEQITTMPTECDDVDTDSSTNGLSTTSVEESNTVKSNMMQRVSNFISPSANHTKHDNNVIATKCDKVGILPSFSSESPFSTSSLRQALPKIIRPVATVSHPAKVSTLEIKTERKAEKSSRRTLSALDEPEAIEVTKNNSVYENKKSKQKQTQSLTTSTSCLVKKLPPIIPQKTPKKLDLESSVLKNNFPIITRRLQPPKVQRSVKKPFLTQSSKLVHEQNKTLGKQHADSPTSTKMTAGSKQNLALTKSTIESKDLNVNHISETKIMECKTVVRKPMKPIKSVAVSRNENVKFSGNKKAVIVRKKNTQRRKGVRQSTSLSKEKVKAKKTSKRRNPKKSIHVVCNDKKISHFGTSLSDSEATLKKQSLKRSQIPEKIKKKGKKKKGKRRKRKIKALLPDACQKNEKVESFKDQFFLFAKFGDRRNSGTTISMANSIRWLKQAGIIDSRKVTKNDVEIFFIFTTQRRRSLTIQEFIHFLNVLASQKGINPVKIIESLISCGEPNTSMTDVTIERMLELNPDNVENPFAEPIFINDSKRQISIAYKSSESYLEAKKVNKHIPQMCVGESEGKHTIPVRFKSSEGFIPELERCAIALTTSCRNIAKVPRKQLETPTVKKMGLSRTSRNTKKATTSQNSQQKRKIVSNSTKPKSKVVLKLKTGLPNFNEGFAKSDMSSSGSGLSPGASSITNRSSNASITKKIQNSAAKKKKKSHPKKPKFTSALEKVSVSPKILNPQNKQQRLASASQDILKFFSKKAKSQMPAKHIRIKKKKRPKRNQNVETLIECIYPSSPTPTSEAV